MTSEEKIDAYLKQIKSAIQLCLEAGDYIGNIGFQINIKGQEIQNMNIDHRKSVKI